MESQTNSSMHLSQVLVSRKGNNVGHNPFTSIKELLSNSIDEGSDIIHIIYDEKNLIICDNGNGCNDVDKGY